MGSYKPVLDVVSWPLNSITQYSLPGEQGQRTTIHMLPGDVLLDIFDTFVFLRDSEQRQECNVRNADSWHPLVHVCQTWRNLVFASPRRLNLRLLCTGRREITSTLDIWPTLPIILLNTAKDPAHWDITIAALEHPDHVRHIEISGVPVALSERVAAATLMQVPFPELTYLHLDASVPTLILHDSFLGGSAPRLRSLCLVSIAFSAIRKLLLSTRDLVNLHLVDVPDSRFISPEELVTCLCELPRLELFGFGFESPQSLPTQRSSPPPTHNVLPSLTGLALHGTGEYVEDFIARIDTPLLKDLIISFIDPILDIPQLYAFICRTDTLELHHEVTLLFFESSSGHWQMSGPTFLTRCTGLGLQVSSMACTCSWLSPLFHNVERLDLINQRPSGSSAEDDIEHTQFLALLRSFSAIKRLRVYKTRTRWWVFSESTFQQ